VRAQLLIVAGVLALAAAAASGQAQRGPATLDDVVNEIRGLRADLRQTTRASTQVQMLTVRLQLQEQRLAVLSTQRNDVNARLVGETRQRAEAERMIQNFEENKGRNEDVGVPRAELENMLKMFRQQFETHRDAERQLQAQDGQLAAEIANEQNRWQDFNNRLDELERSLK
jgi:chromosome segregation ATPase